MAAFTLRKSGGGSTLRGGDALRGAAVTLVVLQAIRVFLLSGSTVGPPGGEEI